MKRVDFHLTERHVEWLKAKSKETGLNVAELIRRALDAFMGHDGGNKKRDK